MARAFYWVGAGCQGVFGFEENRLGTIDLDG